MAVRAFDTGPRQVYDPDKREIREGLGSDLEL